MSHRLLIYSCLFLIFLSPIIIYIRSTQFDLVNKEVFNALSTYSNDGDNILLTSLISITERADLLSVMVSLKQYIDNNGFANVLYYISAFSIYIPSFLLKDKLYPLSTDGTVYGEISSLAWSVAIGSDSTGSLTAFGAISAYREGGWIWVPINGFFTGILMSFLYQKFVRGDTLSKIIFAYFFINICVKMVPPSFFQLFVGLNSTFYIVILSIILNKLLKYK